MDLSCHSSEISSLLQLYTRFVPAHHVMYTSSIILIMVNENKIERLLPSRDIRQGDPLSPYIFIICMDWFSRKIDQEVDQTNWILVPISRGGPIISHLFFADDLTLFDKANRKNYETILWTLNGFNFISGQKVNITKSKVIFSRNINPEDSSLFSSNLGIKASIAFGKYLGFPVFHMRCTNGGFQLIIDNMNIRLAGWKPKFFNKSRRTTLDKASLGSISKHNVIHKLPSSTSK